ncbi:hypothetical protein PROFUN_07987 [Planoprotostelium fungivorum]|uniref:Uncharacterized protein n=1 Tax=Planoprotostelium fungivorum TaxID=1890364 RepID=A0A2P6MV71_9EUKA|nr:hypothetical protein PROFUN_07987 [Planoprotostelium fungivorum]
MQPVLLLTLALFASSLALPPFVLTYYADKSCLVAMSATASPLNVCADSIQGGETFSIIYQLVGGNATLSAYRGTGCTGNVIDVTSYQLGSCLPIGSRYHIATLASTFSTAPGPQDTITEIHADNVCSDNSWVRSGIKYSVPCQPSPCGPYSPGFTKKTICLPWTFPINSGSKRTNSGLTSWRYAEETGRRYKKQGGYAEKEGKKRSVNSTKLNNSEKSTNQTKKREHREHFVSSSQHPDIERLEPWPSDLVFLVGVLWINTSRWELVHVGVARDSCRMNWWTRVSSIFILDWLNRTSSRRRTRRSSRMPKKAGEDEMTATKIECSVEKKASPAPKVSTPVDTEEWTTKSTKSMKSTLSSKSVLTENAGDRLQVFTSSGPMKKIKKKQISRKAKMRKEKVLEKGESLSEQIEKKFLKKVNKNDKRNRWKNLY